MEKINPQDIKAFEWKELWDLTQRLQTLTIQQWVVINTPPEVYEILGRLYNEESIFLTSIEVISSTTFEFWFIFPQYKLTKAWLDHISGVQMTIARFQSLYTAIWLAIKTWAISQVISYESFLMNMYNVLDREYTITHSKVCGAWEEVFLQVTVKEPQKKWNFYMIESTFNRGAKYFLHGRELCVLEDRFT